MPAKIGYLIPTREAIMEGRHETAPLLKLAEQAEDLGYDSVWIGDSLTARPRHDGTKERKGRSTTDQPPPGPRCEATKSRW